MDFRSLLQTMSTLSEGEKTTTEKGTVHKGEYGNKYGKEDVRDQYGHKIGKKDKGAEAKKDAPKKGRGRPKKDTGDAGEKFDSSALASVMGGKKPKKEIGKVSKKHSLKEYMEAVEEKMLNEGVDPMNFDSDEDYYDAVRNQGRPRMSGGEMLDEIARLKSQLRYATSQTQRNYIEKEIAELEHLYYGDDDDLEEDGEAITTKPLPGATQIIGPGGQALGTADAQTANVIKAAAAQGKLNLGGQQGQEVDESDDEKDSGPGILPLAAAGGLGYAAGKGMLDAPIAAAGNALGGLAGAVGLEEEDELDEFIDPDTITHAINALNPATGAIAGAALGKGIEKAADWYAKRKEQKALSQRQQPVRESISLTESPETLEHIINKFKHEVKIFLRGDELDHDLYEALYDYYFNAGEMPYGTAKGRTGDPYEWVTQRFDQDVHDYVVDEGIEDRIGAIPAPIDTNPMTQNPITTPAYVRRAQSLGQPIKQLEGKAMRDMQVESWEKQLNSLLKEGITVSSSQGQEGQPNTVSVTATDSDSDALLSVLRNAGIGGFGAEQEAPQVGYGVAQGGEDEFTGTGTEPQPSPSVVGDDGDMLSMLKKMAGLSGGDAEVVAVSGGDEEGGQDYEDEEGSDDTALQPADGEEGNDEEQDSGEESDDEGEDKEETDEGNAFTGKLKQTPQGGSFKMGDKTYKDKSSIEEGGWDPEQFGSDGSGAGRPGGAGGGDEEESVEEGAEGAAIGAGVGSALGGPLGGAAGGAIGHLAQQGMDSEKKQTNEETCNECGMYESQCGCDHSHVSENFANSAQDPAEQELMKLKALLSMGGDMHKIKGSQATGNVQKVTMEATLNDWKKLSGIK